MSLPNKAELSKHTTAMTSFHPEAVTPPEPRRIPTERRTVFPPDFEERLARAQKAEDDLRELMAAPRTVDTMADTMEKGRQIEIEWREAMGMQVSHDLRHNPGGFWPLPVPDSSPEKSPPTVRPFRKDWEFPGTVDNLITYTSVLI